MRVRRFDLVFNLVAGEQRHFVFVQLQLAQAGGHEALHVILAFGKYARAVDQHFADVIAQVVA